MATNTTTTNGADLETGTARDSAEGKTYQSTLLPGGGQDFYPEAHHRMFRQFANPAPLGLCGFALTTFVLSLVNVHARSVTVPNVVIGLGTALFLFCVDCQPSLMVVWLNSALEC